MNFKKVWKPLLFSAIVLGTVASTTTKTVHAVPYPEKIHNVPVGTKISLNDYGITEYPTTFKWGPNTRLVVEKGSQIGTVDQLYTGAGYWGRINQPPNGTPLYSVNKGDTYRITNIATLKDGTSIDLLLTIDVSGNNNTGGLHGIAFVNGNQVGGGSKKLEGTITHLVTSSNFVREYVNFVKSGTNEKVEATTFAYWNDIDVRQGINEHQSTEAAFIFPNSDLDRDGMVIYAPWDDDVDGNTTVRGSYMGLGRGSGFVLEYAYPYTGGKNSSGVYLPNAMGFRYDLLGKINNAPITIRKDPPAPNGPVKTVTDGGRDVNGQTTKPDKHWVFDVAQELPAMPDKDVHYSSWELVDEIPRTADILGVKMIDEQGNDVASKFNISVSGQKVTATAKSSSLADPNFYQHTYHMKIDTIVNINDQNKTASQLRTDNVAKSTIDGHKKDSNHVIVTPDFTDPKIKKSVAKEGENWVNDEKLDYHHQTYNYKIDFTLSDHADYSSIVVTDHLEDIQTFSGAKVLNAQGEDVTEEWEFAGFPKAGANKDGAMATADITVKAKNPAKYTRIGGTYSILLTDVTLKGAGAYDEAFYVKNGKEVVPNRAKLDWLDKTPDPNEPNHLDSNQTTVTPPNPVDVKIHKEVSVDNRRTYGEHKHLPSHDAKYHWKTTFNLSKLMNYDELILTDHFADVQAPNLDIAKMVRIDQAGKDITHKFDINTTAKENVTEIVAKCKPEFINDFDDIRNDTETELHMTIDDVSLKGVSAISEKKYIKEGIETIPNTAQIVVNPLIKEGFHQDNLFYQNKTSNEAKVDIEKPTKIDVHKKVTVDGGKNWVDVANLPNHDGNYTWKTEFTLPKYNNFEQLVLTDHFADVQFPNLNISKMVSVVQNGRDITSKFSFSTKVNGDNVDVIATLNPELADEFDDIQTDEEAHLEMIIKDVNLKKVKAKAEEKYINERDIEVIPNQTNIKVNPHLSFDQFKQAKDSNISKVNIIRPTDPTVGNPKDKNDRGKQVSIDGGKTWSDFKDLAKHDSLYDWKSTFNPSKYFNFDGHGSLTLTDTFEHLQTIGEVKVATMTNEQLNDLVDKDLVEIQDRAGNRISDKFTFTVEPFNKLAVTIKASVKAEFADEFDDLGGVNQGDLQTIVLYIRQATVRGATGHEEIHYLDADNRVYIPNVAGIKEDSGIKHFTGKVKTNVAKVRLPMVEPAIEKYVEADGDDSGQNHAIDQNAEQNMIMDKALERAQRVLEEVQKLSNIPEDVQKAMDKLVETVAEVSSTADDITKATEKLEERVNKALEKKNDKSEPVTLAEAQEFAQDVLKQVESLPVPYSSDVEKAKKALVDALAESTENKKEEVVAQNIQQLAEYLKKIVEKEKAKQPTEETTTSTSVEGHSTSIRYR